MKRKARWMTVVAVLAGIGSLLSACGERQSQRIAEAEQLALANPDSAAALLADVDTSRLDERTKALYVLTRMLVLEEQWQRRYADTAVCLFDGEEEWSFRRATNFQADSLDEAIDNHISAPALMRAYIYYDNISVGGVTRRETDLRRFGRLCYALSRHHGDNDTLLQADQLYLLAIHCAEACHDHATAYRAYHQLSRHLPSHGPSSSTEAYWCLEQALNHYDQCRDDARWLLTLLNDYGCAYLSQIPLNPRNFPTLIRAANLVARDTQVSQPVCDTVATLIDSLKKAPVRAFSSAMSSSYTDDGRHKTYDLGVAKGLFEDAERVYEKELKEGRAATVADKQRAFDADIRRAVSHFNVSTNTYLAPGYARQAAQLQTRLMSVALAGLLLFILLLFLLFVGWRRNVRRKHAARQAEQELSARRAAEEAQRLAEQLRQRDALIATLRGHIIDKSEILEMLAPTAGKRTVISARNWREIEATLDAADQQFVTRLRSQHPAFGEDDVRLCMLVRLKISNAALSAIYAISVSAVQHRKQKLKKEGFGVKDPAVTLDQLIESF